MIQHPQTRTALLGSLTVTILVAGMTSAEVPSALFVRGYDVIPEPQQVLLRGGDFEFGSGWRLELGSNTKADDVAVEVLREGLVTRYGITLEATGRARGQGKVIALAIRPGSVEIGKALDKNKTALKEQAYRLELGTARITITANAPPGLLYGVETLVQLVKLAEGKPYLPEGTVTDWPDVELREIFWDEIRHLDHLDVLEQAVRRAAFFKINAIALRLNGHFEYASAPALVDPYALSPVQLQKLTDYALRYHIQIIPYLDGPAHVNFILERPEYAKLREFPESAFEMCATNAETYKLLEGMYQDLLDANRGGRYFHLSTDEPWFIGKADNALCHSAERARQVGSPSKLLVEFIQQTATYLHDHGRQVIFWGEPPLEAQDIALLPPWLISGEIYTNPYNGAFRACRIQQMIYTNSQPLDPLFPAYYVLSPQEQLHPRDRTEERATQVFNQISYSSGRQEADVTGAGIYAWGDHGAHPETFWLGYAVGASAAWHPGSPDPHELTHSFYRLFYGRSQTQMGRVHQLMSTQAQFFAHSWESAPSGALPLVFGYSYGLGPFAPHIQTLSLPPVPSDDYLRLNYDWAQQNDVRLKLAWKFVSENDELMDLLYRNLRSVQFNRYNLEVYYSIAELCRQNLLLLKGLEEIGNDLKAAEGAAAKLKYEEAIAALDQALSVAGRVRDERNQALQDTTAIWYKSWFPRVREANGRHVSPTPQDFVETHTSEDARRRQEGLVYLIDREFLLPFGEWVDEVQGVRNRYAAAHKLPVREGKFDWQDTSALHTEPFNRRL